MISEPRTIGFGLVDGEAVFIDVRSDTYFCLDSGQTELTALDHDRQLLEPDDPRLEAFGFVDEPVELVRADVPRPGRSLLDSVAHSAPGLSDVMVIGLLLRNTRDRLRREPLEKCLRDMISDQQAGAVGRTDECITRCERFLGARRLVPFRARDRCLVDSLALLRWLTDRRSGAALVFGVKLDPFAAHCWVQTGDLVLNDRLETVAAFTPVRMISCSDAMQ